jgi:hypothetical protein
VNARQARRLARRIGILLGVLLLDLVIVVLPAGARTPPYCRSVGTVLGGSNMIQSTLEGVAVYDGVSARWLWNSEAMPGSWPEQWVQLATPPVLPSTQALGLLTPFCVLWDHRLELRVDEKYGGAAAEKALRHEFVVRHMADSVIGPKMPKWYWRRFAASDGVMVTWNYALLVHDLLFVVVAGVIGVQLISLTRLSWRHVRAVDEGLCSQCGYDLTDLDGKCCPECGTQIERRPL